MRPHRRVQAGARAPAACAGRDAMALHFSRLRNVRGWHAACSASIRRCRRLAMPEQSRNTGRSETADAVLAYLREHPQAADTLEGIVEWWLPRQRYETERSRIRAALARTRRCRRVALRSAAGRRRSLRTQRSAANVAAELERHLESRTSPGTTSRRTPCQSHSVIPASTSKRFRAACTRSPASPRRSRPSSVVRVADRPTRPCASRAMRTTSVSSAASGRRAR